MSTRTRTGTAVVATALAVAAVSGTVATATPASAASAVTFCFSFANPPTFTTYANRPVFLYFKAPHGWEYLRSGTTGANGCGTFFNTSTSNALAVRAYVSTTYQTWDGWAPYSAPAGGGSYYLGKGQVYRTR